MFLQRLLEYAAQHPPGAPRMYVRAPIKWLIDLDDQGRLLGFVPTVGDGSGRKDLGMVCSTPFIKRSSDVKARLLADNGQYVLGLADEDGDAKRAAECHQAFVAEVRECAKTVPVPAVQVVLRFLEGPVPSRIPADVRPGDALTFRVGEVLPISLPEVQSYWVDRVSGNDTGPLMDCIVCGNTRRVMPRLPLAIKGVPTKQPAAGATLISANEAAFESYGLQASLIAPICRHCAEETHKALNELLADKRTHYQVGSVVLVAWAREENSLLETVFAPTPESVSSLMNSVFTGGVAANPDGVHANDFWAASLSTSGNRIVVREWLDTSLDVMKERLVRYFTAQRIIRGNGERIHPLGIFALAASTVPDKSKQGPPPGVVDELLRVALGGRAVSRWLLGEALRRNRMERRVTQPRAALVKLYLMTQSGASPKEGELVTLEPEIENAGYLCGRLLALLEWTQDAANWKGQKQSGQASGTAASKPAGKTTTKESTEGLNRTLVERYYGTASTAPAVVFPSLMKLALMAHLPKVRRAHPSTYTFLDRKLCEVHQKLQFFPRMLSLDDQAMFTLGYHHQKAERFAGSDSRANAEEIVAVADVDVEEG